MHRVFNTAIGVIAPCRIGFLMFLVVQADRNDDIVPGVEQAQQVSVKFSTHIGILKVLEYRVGVYDFLAVKYYRLVRMILKVLGLQCLHLESEVLKSETSPAKGYLFRTELLTSQACMRS
jgi:hypothetical protein